MCSPAAYPPLDVSIEELTFGDVDPVPCDGQLQLFIVGAGVHGRAVFTGYTHQGAPESTRSVLPTHQRCEKMGSPTSHQSFKQDRVKVIRALLLSVVDGDEVFVLVNAQSLTSREMENTS